jgi:hypothetical protein
MANVRSTITWLLERDKCEQNIPPRRTRRSLIRADVHFHITHTHTQKHRDQSHQSILRFCQVLHHRPLSSTPQTHQGAWQRIHS